MFNDEETSGRGLVHHLRTFWRTWVLVLTPLLASLVIFLGEDSSAMRCLFVLILMAIYWVCEVFPVAVTALIPLVLFPILGIMSTSVVSLAYMKSTNFMFMGGLVLALVVENTGLHRRVALSMLALIGTQPRRIMLSFMLTTGFLSMWISNTAATAMMLPIVEAVSLTLQKEDEQKSGSHVDPYRSVFRRQVLLLSVAYAANIGGTGVVTGSPPNLVLPEKLDSLYSDHTLTYANWLLMSVPLMLLNLGLAWIWLQVFQWLKTRKMKNGNGNVEVEMRNSSNHDSNGHKTNQSTGALDQLIKRERLELGPWKTQEIIIICLFSILVLLWFFIKPKFMPGWGELFTTVNPQGKKVTVGSATPAILMVLVTFMLPVNFGCFSGRRSQPLVEWGGPNGVEKRLPWGVILLLGGGFALSGGSEESGLSEWLADRLALLGNWPTWLISLAICLATAMITEFVSNTATANVLIPILVEISKKLCLNPIYLAFSSTLSCSYAFMLPAATAPNAIIKEVSGISVYDMLQAGVVMNLICILTTVLAFNVYGGLIFQLGSQLPQWALEGLNGTCTNS